jgi:hypothetical protein
MTGYISVGKTDVLAALVNRQRVVGWEKEIQLKNILEQGHLDGSTFSKRVVVELSTEADEITNLMVEGRAVVSRTLTESLD